MQDALIAKRFEELSERIKTVLATGQKEGPFYNYNPELLQQWVVNVLNLLQRVFGADSPHFQRFTEEYSRHDQGYYKLENAIGVFRGAKDDYENGYLFNVHSLLKAEILTGDVLAQAQELLDAGYKDPACILVGVALESTLKELCTKNSIPHAKMDKMNVDLCRAGVYNLAKQKQITAWADLRNKAAHGQWGEYTAGEAKYMLDGVEQFLADYL